MTTARSIIILSILFAFHSLLSAQPQFGAKIGRTYMINVGDYYASSGNNIGIFVLPLRFNHVLIGTEIEFNTKGFLEETSAPHDVKPIEYLSLALPIKFSPFNGVETEFYAFAAGHYDIVLTSVKNFQDVGGDRRFNSTMVTPLALARNTQKLSQILL